MPNRDRSANLQPFKKGTSGNPAGRPPEVKHVRELARAMTADALSCLVDVMKHSLSDTARVSAANAILDRGHGKPGQSVELTGAEVVDKEKEHLDVRARLEAKLNRYAEVIELQRAEDAARNLPN